MSHFVGLDVSVKETSVCVLDDTGKVLYERKVPTEPDDIAVLLTSIGGDYVRIGIEAGPLSQWLVNGLAEAGLPVICVETRHMKALLKAQQVNKSDRHDARGIAQMRSEEHTSELQSLMRISYAVFCLKKKNNNK